MMPGPNNTNDYEITGAILKGGITTDKYRDNYDKIFGKKKKKDKKKEGRS